MSTPRVYMLLALLQHGPPVPAHGTCRSRMRQQCCDEACCCWQCRGTAVAAGVLCVVHGSCVSKHDWSRLVMWQAHYCSVCASRERPGPYQRVSTKIVCRTGQCNVPYAMQLVRRWPCRFLRLRHCSQGMLSWLWGQGVGVKVCMVQRLQFNSQQ